MLRTLGGFAAFGLFWRAWGAILPAVKSEAGVSDGQLGAALLMVGLGALVSMRFTGYLIDRYGGVVLPVAVFLFALCGDLPALADSAITLQRRFEPALLVFGVLCALSFVVENAWQSWGAVHLDTTYNAALPSPPALRRSSPRPQPPEGSVATHS